MMWMRALSVGLSAILFETEDLASAMGLFNAITAKRQDPALSAVVEVMPAARSVLLRFDSLRATNRGIVEAIGSLDVKAGQEEVHRTVSIPVIYNGEDLETVARLLGISADEVVRRHAAHAWTAAFVGFAPGFAYLTGGDPIFDVPRRDSPRLAVPQGAVGLAGTFSGVYPRRSSGGWQLIGSTAYAMWDERRDSPASVQPGDIVEFQPVREQVTPTRPAAAVPAERPAMAFAGDDDDTDTAAVTVVPGDCQTSSCHEKTAGALLVERPGMLALFEDDGRCALAMGVAASGSADWYSAHLANRLVGNPSDDPVVEITAGDASFTALRDVVLAIAGAHVPITVCGTDDARTRIECQEAFVLRGGERVDIGLPVDGLRDYLALQGGFAVERVLGSASRDTMADIGPEPLRPAGVLHAANHSHESVGIRVPWPKFPASGESAELQVILGPRDDWFTAESIRDLLHAPWLVTPQSNRVGLRLSADKPLERKREGELASEGTVSGSIEVPNDGQPVLLLRDQPVTGGYPVVAVLSEPSLVLAAQLPVGALIRFVPAEPDGWQRERMRREEMRR